MKHYFFLFGVLFLLNFSACKKDGDFDKSCNLPSTQVPSEMTGSWANGYNSRTNLYDAYNGKYLGNNFQSGKYFHFPGDGKRAEFFIMVNAGIYSSAATKAVGTVEFLDDDSFIFHVCQAHYKGWQNGQLTVDRDATDAEAAGLTRKYYYSFVTTGDNVWMQIKFDPNDEYGTSFSKVP